MDSGKTKFIQYTSEECKLLLQSFKSLAFVIEEHAELVRAKAVKSLTPVPIAKPPAPKPIDVSNVNLQVGRREKMDLKIKIVFLKLGKIETIRDKFSAKVMVQTKWREPKLDSSKEKGQRFEINPGDYWNPNLYLLNANSDVKETVTHHCVFNQSGRAEIVQKRIANGSFTEFMELNEFPFDSQDLSVSVCSRRPKEEVCFVEEKSEPCAVNIEMFLDAQEWHLLKCVNTWDKEREDASQSQKTTHSIFAAGARVSRRCEFFLWNAILILFMITTLSLLTFVMGVTAPQNRLQLTVILLLNIVNLKSVINQSLPSVAYLTYLDKYLLACGAILTGISIWHAVANFLISLLGQSLVETIDSYVSYGFLGLYFLLNFIIVFIILSSKHALKSEMDEASKNGATALDCDVDSKQYMPKQFTDLDEKPVERSANQNDQFTTNQTLM